MNSSPAVAAGLCTTRQVGRGVHLAFTAEGKALWQLALPTLRSPVRRIYAVTSPRRTAGIPRAGLTALSRQTALEDDGVPTYAAHDVALSTAVRVGDLTLSDTPEDADVIFEAWRYNPLILGTERVVDPLSLYLSLRDSPDERVQQALETLVGAQRW